MIIYIFFNACGFIDFRCPIGTAYPASEALISFLAPYNKAQGGLNYASSGTVTSGTEADDLAALKSDTNYAAYVGFVVTLIIAAVIVVLVSVADWTFQLPLLLKRIDLLTRHHYCEPNSALIRFATPSGGLHTLALLSVVVGYCFLLFFTRKQTIVEQNTFLVAIDDLPGSYYKIKIEAFDPMLRHNESACDSDAFIWLNLDSRQGFSNYFVNCYTLADEVLAGDEQYGVNGHILVCPVERNPVTGLCTATFTTDYQGTSQISSASRIAAKIHWRYSIVIWTFQATQPSLKSMKPIQYFNTVDLPTSGDQGDKQAAVIGPDSSAVYSGASGAYYAEGFHILASPNGHNPTNVLLNAVPYNIIDERQNTHMKSGGYGVSWLGYNDGGFGVGEYTDDVLDIDTLGVTFHNVIFQLKACQWGFNTYIKESEDNVQLATNIISATMAIFAVYAAAYIQWERLFHQRTSVSTKLKYGAKITAYSGSPTVVRRSNASTAAVSSASEMTRDKEETMWSVEMSTKSSRRGQSKEDCNNVVEFNAQKEANLSEGLDDRIESNPDFERNR